MSDDPMHRTTLEPLRLRLAPRCRAQTRSGKPCQSPVVRGRSAVGCTVAQAAVAALRENGTGNSATPRCRAQTRSGKPCQSPIVRGKKRCRVHGGASGSGGPPGERNGQFRHGERTKAAIAERRKFSAFRLVGSETKPHACQLLRACRSRADCPFPRPGEQARAMTPPSRDEDFGNKAGMHPEPPTGILPLCRGNVANLA
jgi:glucans biosynthesis protein